MEKYFQISEISRLLKIPASKLRYWEETGVLSPKRNAENDYRTYTLSDLMTIADIVFYKNLGLSLKQIRAMEELTPIQHQQLLQIKEQALKDQQQEIKRRIQKLHARLDAIEIVEKLKAFPFTVTDIDSDCIVPFELFEIEKLQHYIDNPYLYSRVQHSGNLSYEQRGLTLSAKQAADLKDEQKLWKKADHRYAVCLMKEEITDDFPNNLPELLAHVQKTYQTGYIISRFLLCAKEDGRLYDFYKTYIEILE